MVRKYGKRNRYGSRYVARNAHGEFISNVDVGRSLAQDRRIKAKNQDEQQGFGQMGDERRAEFAAQGYDDKLDESLGMSHRGSKIRQSFKDRRDESKGMEKSRGRRAYSRVKTMDKAAQGYDDKLDESLGMSHRGSKIRQSFKDRRDESKGMEKSRGRRAYSRVGTMDKNADYFVNAVGGFYPTGDGRAFGSMTLHDTYAPLAAAEGDVKSGFKTGLGATLGIIGGLVVAGYLGNLLSSFKKPSDE